MAKAPSEPQRPPEPAGELQAVAALGERLAGARDEATLAEVCAAAAPSLLGARAVAYVTEEAARCAGASWDQDTLAVLRHTGGAALATGGRVVTLAEEALPPQIAQALAPGEVIEVARLRVREEPLGLIAAMLPAGSARGRALLSMLAQLCSGCLGGLRRVAAFVDQAREIEAQLARRTRELRTAEDQLIASDRLATLGMLAAGIGHEIANPLATIMLNSGALNGRLARAALPAGLLTEAQRLLAENDEALERIRAIVNELRTFARKGDEGLVALDLRAVVDSSLRLCRAQLRGIEVKVELPQLPVVRGSSSRLAQVLLNLLVNAAHAVQGVAEPRIEVRGEVHAGEVHITVADNGPGVPAQVREQIFDMFFTTKPSGEGTGLGLAISRDIMKRHGGRLELCAAAEAAGGGACLRLVLPRRPDTDQAERPRTPSSPAIKPARRKPSVPSIRRPSAPAEPQPRLLIVDDEQMILRALARELDDEFEVITAKSGEEAIAAYADGRFDVVLCDVNLAGESGLELGDKLAALDPRAPDCTVYMSASLPTSRSVDAARFVAKPFDVGALVKKLRELAGR